MTKELIDQWKHAKQQENLWNQKRVEIESQIYEQHQASIPDKGTYTTPEGMKIATGFAEDWDHAKLNTAYEQWPANLKFPFNGVWKPNSKAISYLRDNAPEAYELLRPALTLKPKKPSFSLKE